jgi:hypothetical protein
MVFMAFIVACIVYVIFKQCCSSPEQKNGRGDMEGPIPAMAYNANQHPAAELEYQVQVAIALSASEADEVDSDALPIARIISEPQLEAELAMTSRYGLQAIGPRTNV